MLLARTSAPKAYAKSQPPVIVFNRCSDENFTYFVSILSCPFAIVENDVIPTNHFQYDPHDNSIFEAGPAEMAMVKDRTILIDEIMNLISVQEPRSAGLFPRITYLELDVRARHYILLDRAERLGVQNAERVVREVTSHFIYSKVRSLSGLRLLFWLYMNCRALAIRMNNRIGHLLGNTYESHQEECDEEIEFMTGRLLIYFE